MMEEQPAEKDWEYFCDRLTELQQEMRSYGIASIVVLHEDNPIAQETTTFINWHGGLPVCIGLAKVAESRLTEAYLAKD